MDKQLDKWLLEYADRGERTVPPGYAKEIVIQRRAELFWGGYANGDVQPGDDNRAVSAVLDGLTPRGRAYLELLRQEFQHN